MTNLHCITVIETAHNFKNFGYVEPIVMRVCLRIIDTDKDFEHSQIDTLDQFFTFDKTLPQYSDDTVKQFTSYGLYPESWDSALTPKDVIEDIHKFLNRYPLLMLLGHRVSFVSGILGQMGLLKHFNCEVDNISICKKWANENGLHFNSFALKSMVPLLDTAHTYELGTFQQNPLERFMNYFMHLKEKTKLC